MNGTVIRGTSLTNHSGEERAEPLELRENHSANNEYKLAMLRRKQQLEADNMRKVNQIANSVKNNIKEHILFANSAQKQKVLTLKIKERIKADLEIRDYKVKSNQVNERLRTFSDNKEQQRGRKNMLKIDNRSK